MSLKDTIDAIKKSHGVTVGELTKVHVDVDRLSTWSLSIDYVLGWGIPKGRVIEMYGENGSGKTFCSLMFIAEQQRNWLTCAFIDMEHAFDLNFAKMIGVDVDSLLFVQPDNGEMGLDIAEKLCLSGEVDIIVVDSVAALLPKKEVEGDMWSNHVGLHARLMAQWLRKITPVAAKQGTTVVFINQTRMNIGRYASMTTTGWKSLAFFASQRWSVRRDEWVEEKGKKKGYMMEITVTKNKTGVPHGSCKLYIEWGVGLDPKHDTFTIGKELWIIKRSWSYYSYHDVKWQGMQWFVNALTDETMAQIREEVLSLR